MEKKERYIRNSRFFDDKHLNMRGFRHIQASMELHRQEFSEVVIVLNGASSYLTEPGPSFPIARGDILITPPGGMHGYENAQDLEIIGLMFVADRLPLPLLNLYRHPNYKLLFSRQGGYYMSTGFNYPRLMFAEEEFKIIEQLGNIFIECQNGNTPGGDCERLGLFMCLIGRICDCWHQTGDDKNNSSNDAEGQPDIYPIVSYLAANLGRNVTLEELALHFSMSKNTMLRHFRKMTGVTPMAYLMQLRVETAAEFLLNTDLRINEIADCCGFNHSSHFIQVFRKYHGLTPSQFREVKVFGKNKS